MSALSPAEALAIVLVAIVGASLFVGAVHFAQFHMAPMGPIPW